MAMLTTNSLIAGARALSAELGSLTLKRAILIEYGIVLIIGYFLRWSSLGFYRGLGLTSKTLYWVRDFLISLVGATVLCFFMAWLAAVNR